jgi:amino acid transporter
MPFSSPIIWSTTFPSIDGWKHYLVSVALIAVITWINVRGIQMVGKVATALEIFIFVPV